MVPNGIDNPAIAIHPNHHITSTNYIINVTIGFKSMNLTNFFSFNFPLLSAYYICIKYTA